ncbi:hypothetical protein [Streptomyces sp. NPDC005799]|uniref:hypothetical protein n=1 Tax=Streptomyces sp. NPDC005799 TaxID=3154678 RepID=UPI0033DDC70B
MAVSLGMRISGLLVAGAVAVAVAAFGGDGSGGPDGGGGGSSIVTTGPTVTDGPRTAPPSPTPRQSPAGEATGTVGPDVPRHRPGAATPRRSSPTTSPGHSSSLLLSPGWLPPGPASPNADPTPDPAGVYDQLRDPGRCRAARTVVPAASADPEWRVLRALATACLAVQGRGGGWATAADDYGALAGKVGTCKGRAAYAVLGGLLELHRLHPHATVRLKASSSSAPACAYRIAGVDTEVAQPGDTVGIELHGTCFDPAELPRFASVSIGGRALPVPPVLRSVSGDEVVLSAVVPVLASYPASVDVVVRYGSTEARLKDAFTVVAPTVTVPSPGQSSPPPEGARPPAGPGSRTPERVFPLRPLPAHLPRP